MSYKNKYTPWGQCISLISPQGIVVLCNLLVASTPYCLLYLLQFQPRGQTNHYLDSVHMLSFQKRQSFVNPAFSATESVDNATNKLDRVAEDDEEDLTTPDLLAFAWQVAKGMVSKNNILRALILRQKNAHMCVSLAGEGLYFASCENVVQLIAKY